jgi:hypothetical protein
MHDSQPCRDLVRSRFRVLWEPASLFGEVDANDIETDAIFVVAKSLSRKMMGRRSIWSSVGSYCMQAFEIAAPS